MRHGMILLLAGALVTGCGGRKDADAPPVDAPAGTETDVATGIARSVADVDAANAAAAAPPDIGG